MFCKWCGLESTTTDVCSWCRRPFGSPAQASPASQPAAAKAVAPPQQRSSASPQAAASPLPDDMDDDLSPSPFGSPMLPQSPARPVAAPSAPPPAPPAAPTAPVFTPASRPPSPQAAPPSAPPARTLPPAIPPAQRSAPPPPLPLGRVGSTYTPPVARQPAEGPSLEAIPIRRSGLGAPLDIKKPEPPPPSVMPPAHAAPPEAPTAYVAPAPVRLAPPEPEPEPFIPAPPIVAAPPTPAPITPPPPVVMPPPAPVMAPPPVMSPPPAPPMAARYNEPDPIDDEPGFVAQAPRQFDLGSGGGLAPPRSPLTGPSSSPEPGPFNGRSGGHKTLCRWCGMDSDSSDTCTWCRKDLRSLPPTTPAMLQPVGTSKRHNPPNRGPVRQAVSRTPATVPSTQSSVATAKAPALGSFQAQKSKYYSDKVMDPVSGAHYDPDTGQSVDQVEFKTPGIGNDEVRSDLQNAGKYLLVLIGVVALLSGIGKFMPSAFLALLAVGAGSAGLLLPMMHVVPFAHQDSDEVTLAVAFMLILGPIVGGICYIVLCLARGSGNPALVGIFITYMLVRVPLDLVTGHPLIFASFLPFTQPPTGVSWADHLVGIYCVGAGVVGWYAADSFRSLDD